MGGSPQAAASPHHTASPQVPSPQGQTLDLSVSRVPARWVLSSVTGVTWCGWHASWNGGDVAAWLNTSWSCEVVGYWPADEAEVVLQSMPT